MRRGQLFPISRAAPHTPCKQKQHESVDFAFPRVRGALWTGTANFVDLRLRPLHMTVVVRRKLALQSAVLREQLLFVY